MNGRAKNNNLSIYREQQGELNKALIQRAIEHIKKLNGEISFSLVSKVTYDIADSIKGEKGISLAGISKNKLYRSMIEKAKLSNGVNDKNIGNTSRTTISVGDMQISYHAMRIENMNLKRENKILSKSLQEMDTPKMEIGNIDKTIIKKFEEMKQICTSMVNRLLELELAYIDMSCSTLNVAIYDDVLVGKESLELFYKKELDNALKD